MGYVVWLLFEVPKWYFSVVLLSPRAVLASPRSDGLLLISIVIPTIGIIGLIIGGVWGAVVRARGLLLFLMLPAASQILVAVAGLMKGQFREPSLYHLISVLLEIFVLLQIAGAGYLVFRSKGARLPATALAIFTSSYAIFASFVAAMAFTDLWV